LALRPLGLRTFVLGLGTLAATIAAMGSTAAAANAALGVSCPDPTSQPFAAWGDSSSYVLAPNGGLEDGATGWTLTGGAKVVAGNEAFSVSGAGSHSLSLPAGSSATTAPMCIGLGSVQMRMFTSNSGSAASKLQVQVVYGGGAGALLGSLGSGLGLSDAGTIASGADWQPSPVVSMLLGGTAPLLTQYVQFRFTPLSTGGNWRIDDVYLDPLMHR
jgi:hypothetical protein